MKLLTNQEAWEAEGYWLSPLYLVETLNRMPVEFSLLLVRMYYHAWKAGDEWHRVELAELAAGAGLSMERAEVALASLVKQGWVERQEERYGLTPEAGEGVLDYPPMPEV